MSRIRTVSHDLRHARAAHDRVYNVEVHDGASWVPGGRLVVTRDMVLHGGKHVHTVDYHGAHHTLSIRGKAGDPTFQAKFHLTECGNGFIGTMSTGGRAPVAVRGTGLEQVYHTKRRPKDDPTSPLEVWDDLTVRSEWAGTELKITYLLGFEDISDRTRVTKVDRPKGQTTLEMVERFTPPFRQNSFLIVLASGNRTFAGTLTDEDTTEYEWSGDTANAAAKEVSTATRENRVAALADATPSATMTLQDLDNISSIQVVTDNTGKQYTVDFAQTTCGTYYNKCLANALEKKWVDGIYGRPFDLSARVQNVLNANKQVFSDNAVLGTGQMLYDNLGTSPQYKDLIARIDSKAMETAWTGLGSNPDTGPQYQEATSALYIEAYRDGVAAMRPYLENNPAKWAEDYYNWLTDTANLLTWQIQVASKQFDNVKTRMYEWYTKLQVLAPDNDYGKRFMTIAYSALLGVNYSKALWSEDLRPFLENMILNGVAGKVDPAVMDQVQQQAAEENQALLRLLVSNTELAIQLANAIAGAFAAYRLKKTMQQIVEDPQIVADVGTRLTGPQYEAWSSLTKSGKAKGVISMLAYGAAAGFLIYSMVEDGKGEQTPKTVIEEVNMGVLVLAMFVKGLEKMMSMGVGRFLENFAAGGQGGAFRIFAGDVATWFKEGGKIIPQGKAGKAFVSVFGQSSTEFIARRVGPALAVFGLVLAAYTLYESIKAGIVRNIVFEALNTFVALATVVLIGFELASFAWAGPAGLAVAAVGVVILLIQLIWNLIDPPKPPPDPIKEFVTGPMVQKGFATA
jgi:hypothetical protein